METNSSPVDDLIASAEQYNKINLGLLKLKSIDKTADIVSTLTSRTLLVITISIVLLMLTITASLWLGELLGKYYYGFLLVSIAYAILGILLLLVHKHIKSNVADRIIKQMLN
jgi:hypothetical protein